MSVGMGKLNCAGTDVAMLLRPIGPSPETPTCMNATFAGDVTVTDDVCPELTTVLSTGDVIRSCGGFCWALQTDATINDASSMPALILHRSNIGGDFVSFFMSVA